jgi:hypothetical protein
LCGDWVGQPLKAVRVAGDSWEAAFPR